MFEGPGREGGLSEGIAGIKGMAGHEMSMPSNRATVYPRNTLGSIPETEYFSFFHQNLCLRALGGRGVCQRASQA